MKWVYDMPRRIGLDWIAILLGIARRGGKELGLGLVGWLDGEEGWKGGRGRAG